MIKELIRLMRIKSNYSYSLEDITKLILYESGDADKEKAELKAREVYLCIRAAGRAEIRNNIKEFSLRECIDIDNYGFIDNIPIDKYSDYNIDHHSLISLLKKRLSNSYIASLFNISKKHLIKRKNDLENNY